MDVRFGAKLRVVDQNKQPIKDVRQAAAIANGYYGQFMNQQAAPGAEPVDFIDLLHRQDQPNTSFETMVLHDEPSEGGEVDPYKGVTLILTGDDVKAFETTKAGKLRAGFKSFAQKLLDAAAQTTIPPNELSQKFRFLRKEFQGLAGEAERATKAEFLAQASDYVSGQAAQ